MEKVNIDVMLDVKGKFQSHSLFKQVGFVIVPRSGDYIALTPHGLKNWAKVTLVVLNPGDTNLAPAIIWCTMERDKLDKKDNQITATELTQNFGWQFI